jgi:hypothetical protein
VIAVLNVLSTPTYDSDGYVELSPIAVPDRDVTRRANRVLTLDGGVAVNDGGYSDGDLVFELEWTPDVTIDTQVKRMVRLYPRAVLSTRDGVFEVVLESYRLNAESTFLRCLPVRRLSL